MQSKPIWKPKLRQETGKYWESAETELESCYRRKPPDEFAGLADGDPHWGRLWPTAGGKTESYAIWVSILAPVFINTYTCTHVYKQRKNSDFNTDLIQVFINTHLLMLMHADIQCARRYVHSLMLHKHTHTHCTDIKPPWTLIHNTKRWGYLILPQQETHTPRRPHCPAAHRGILLFYQ